MTDRQKKSGSAAGPQVDLSTLNDNQRKIAQTLDEPLFVEAGAGSGKTFTLTQRVTWALAPGSAADGGAFLDDLGQVLVITFTEAAAREIRERVRANLRRCGMAEASLAVDDAWISTIHGMCSRILHRHALDLGLDPEFGVVTGSAQESLLFSAMDEVMSEARKDPELRAAIDELGSGDYAPASGYSGAMKLVKNILDAASALPGGIDSLSCAAAGTGDGDVAHLMRDLLMRMEELGAEKLTAAAAGKVGPSLEALRAFDALAPGKKDAAAALEALVSVSMPTKSKAIAEKLAAAKESFSLARAEVAFAAAADRAPSFLELARRVEASYAARKLDQGVLDNDDLVKQAYAAVRDCPAVRRDYAGRFKLVMVDEFQDTDETQLALIELLAGEGARHLATVGDAQQSIYRFRGADVDVFYRRGEGVGESGLVRLDTNYRSHGDVLKFVERVSRGNRDGALGTGGGASGTMASFMHLDDCPTRKDAFRARDLPRIDVEVTAGKGVSGYATGHQSAMAAVQVADALARYRDHGERPGDMALLLGVTTHAGLYIDAIRARGMECVVTGGSTFTSTPEVKVMCALLHTLANPADTQSGLFPLLASEMFGLDANDFCELGTKQQEKLDACAKRPIEQGIAVFDLVGGHTPSRRLARARDIVVRALDEVSVRPVADVCEQVARESGWLARLEAQGPAGLARAANVLAAVRYIRDLTSSMGLGPARAATEFDLWLAASKIAPASLAGAEGEGGGTVRIMTIHASKGLEFPVTAVAECWGNPRSDASLAVMPAARGKGPELILKPLSPDKDAAKALFGIDAEEAAEDVQLGRDLPLCARYVGLRSMGDAAAAEEKARLLYVAMTRAREALILSVNAAGGKEGVSSKLASDALYALFGAEAAPAPGVCEVDFGGETPARVRCVQVEQEGKGAEKVVRADSGNTLEGVDGGLPANPADLLAPGGAKTGTAESKGTDGGDAPTSFDLYAIEPPVEGLLGTWSTREGVYSYSSVHREALEKGGERLPLPTRGQRDAEDAGAPVDADEDRATNLGSAFHELAQSMVESGEAPNKAQVDAMCVRWNLSARARKRLEGALALWGASSIREEALAHGRVRAEAPFFVAAPSEHGEYLEGAIDLLCTDPGSNEALVIDYKTGDLGLSAEAVRARHAMQAEFYARVLLDQGLKGVECAFVCVEREDPDSPGEPLVVRYRF